MKKPPVSISVCMATRNEEAAIGKVVREFQTAIGREIEFVMVDSSTDRTAAIARQMGVRVIRQPPGGYGRALREALLRATGEVLVTVDCDDTYPATAVPSMIAKMAEGFDVVSGSRLLGKQRVPSMPWMNELGNRWFAFLVRLLYAIPCTDATTGMRVFRRNVIQSIEWTENTGLSLELFFKPAVLGYRVTEVPIGYRERRGDTKLNPLKGGLEMLGTLIRYKLQPIRKRTGK